ncbi:hypothetical protein M3Y97_00240800 [Aphelenchoides bicaudatus]|nr:hypothetical protein M3Y97_00240800 [Aphelenchoides bicaudatus]
MSYDIRRMALMIWRTAAYPTPPSPSILIRVETPYLIIQFARIRTTKEQICKRWPKLVESDDEELPEPPKPVESRNTLTTTPATITHQTTNLSPAADSAAETASNDPASETVSPISNPASAANEPKRPSGSERLAGIVYGYGEESPLNWSKSKLKSNAFGDSDKPSDDKENTAGQAPQLTSSYVNTSYTSSFVPPGQSAFQHSRRYDYPPSALGMNDPPLDTAPPIGLRLRKCHAR